MTPKDEKPKERPTALVAGFNSHGKRYYVLRLPRELGEALKEGDRYEYEMKGGVLTLKKAKA
jgi:hypothetical protein